MRASPVVGLELASGEVPQWKFFTVGSTESEGIRRTVLAITASMPSVGSSCRRIHTYGIA
jgi:hypothetical protein